MKKIEYNATVLNLIEKLSFINQSILMEKQDELITIASANPEESIAYIFKAPESSFDFDGENCAFYNYAEFHKLFSVLDNPVIKQDGVNLILSKDKSKINYRTTDPEVINKTFRKVDFDEPEVVLNLTSDQIKKIRSMGSTGMLNANRLKLSVEDDTLGIRLWNKKHDNTFEDSFTLENSVEDSFSFDILTDVFNQIPEGNYQLSIKSEGIVEFKLISDNNVDLKIYTAEVEDE